MILPNPKLRPLSEVRIGSLVRIGSIEGGKRMGRRLSEMGLRPGAVTEVVSGEGGGPVVLRVDGTRLALGRGMARRILVETFS
jgi:Fe2+ transport system protein FeoA